MTQIIIDKIQFKRGSTASRIALVLDVGEPFYDEDLAAEYIGDGVTLGGNPSGGDAAGITLGAADARYVKLSQINAAGGVAGLDANTLLFETQLPEPPVDLSILFANKIA